MRFLLVTYYFPPCGGAAVMRWYRLIKALNNLGHQVTVICPLKADYPQYDESLEMEETPLLKIRRAGKASIFGLWSKVSSRALPYGSLETHISDSFFRRVLIWIRLNLIIPDIRILWVPAALKACRDQLRTDSYDAVITTGPPHSTHLVAWWLKRRLRFFWVADFRDPWSMIHYLSLAKPSSLTMALHRYLERKVLASADLNLVVSHYIASSLPTGKKEVLYNGYSKEDFEHLTYESSPRFRVKYIGSITAGQKPEKLLELLSAGDIELDLYTIGSASFPPIDKKSKINLIQVPFLDHSQALEHMVHAELLVLLINDYPGSEGMLTTKIFEYIASGRPILCLGNPFSEAANLIVDNGIGEACSYEDLSSGVLYLKEVYRKWTEGMAIPSKPGWATFESANQAKALLSSIDKAIHS